MFGSLYLQWMGSESATNVAAGNNFQRFYYFHPEPLSGVRKKLYDAFLVSGPSIPCKIALVPDYHLGSVSG